MKAIKGQVSFCNTIQGITCSHNMRSGCATFVVSTTDEVTALPGAACSIYMGLDSLTKQITGYIDSIEFQKRTGITKVSGRDTLRRAVDYFLAPQEDGSPEYTSINDDAGKNIENLMNIAGLTTPSIVIGYNLAPGFPFSCMSVWEAASEIARLTLWRIYADSNGIIRAASDSLSVPDPVHTITMNSEIIETNLITSCDEVINRMIVIGASSNIRAEKTDPLSPLSWTKTGLISSEYIPDQATAELIAEYNLSVYKNLIQIASIRILGGENIFTGEGIRIIGGDCAGDWLVYETKKTLSSDGLTNTLTIRRTI